MKRPKTPSTSSSFPSRAACRIPPGKVATCLAVACTLWASCDRPADDLPEYARSRIDTVGGVEHVISGARGPWMRRGAWQVGEPILEIGALDGPEVRTFGAVAAVALGEDGDLYVADGQALEIRVFDRDGAFLRRFGRDGEGPGEFRDISGIGFAPDGTLAVVDGRLNRLTLLDTDGEYIRSFRLHRPYMQLVRRELWFDDDGRFYDRVQLSTMPRLDSLGIVVYAPDGDAMDSLLVSVHEPHMVTMTRGGVPIMSIRIPYAPEPSATVGPHGRIYVTPGDKYHITVLDPTGDTIRVLERGLEPPAVTDAERADAEAWIRDRMIDAGGTPPARIELPDEKAVIDGLHTDATGHLWVRMPMGPGWTRTEYGVFDPDGRYLGALTMPPLTVHRITRDRVAGVAVDSLGVQRVVVLPIVKPSRP